MTDTERIKKAIKWLIGTGIAKNQEGIGVLMGYSNKSAFSQVVNTPNKRPEDFITRLCNLNNNLNKDWLLTEKGSMLKTTDQPVSQGGEDVTPPKTELNNPKTMERLFELIKDQQRQTSELVADLREERLNRKEEVSRFLSLIEKMQGIAGAGTTAQKKEA